MKFDRDEHPPELVLSRFADGALPPDTHRELAAHLEACARCRTTVRFFGELGAAVRAIHSRGHAVPDVADAVIERRRAGERVILSEIPARSWMGLRGRVSGAIAAGLAATVVASAYLLLAPEAAATRGEVRFGSVPEHERGGVPVTYTPAYYLAAEDSLRLRARVATSPDASVRQSRGGEFRVVTLRRGADGLFRGHLPRMEGDLFAVAVIEDFGAMTLDTNLGKLWTTYLDGNRDEPASAALESHYRSLESYNPFVAAEFARELTIRYPDRPLGWALTSGGAPVPTTDSALAAHRTKLRDLIERAGVRADAADLPWLSLYAARAGDVAARDSLLDELERLQPEHPAVLNRRVLEATREAPFASRELVSRLEHLWDTSPRPSELLVHMGVQASAAAGQRDELQAWIQRARRHPAVDPRDVARAIERFPDLADIRAGLLRDRLAELELDDDLSRPLRVALPEHEARRRTEVLDLKIELAKALIYSGDETSAAALYREAAEHGWRPKDIQPYVELLLAQGDTAAALPTIGLLLADPIPGEASGEEYARTLATRVPDARSFMAGARKELAGRALTSVPRTSRIRGDTPLTLSTGRATTARELFSGHPTVLLLWDGRFGTESDRLTSFSALADRSPEAVRTAIVVSRLGETMPTTGPPPLIVDGGRELAAQIREFALPALVIVDSDLAVMRTIPDVVDAFRVATMLTW